MRSRWIALSVWLCLLGGALAGTAVEWTFAASDHFEVYTTAGERRAREALSHYERVHAFFSAYFNRSLESSERTQLVVFSSEAEFAPYAPNEFATAFYQSGTGRDRIVMRSLDADAVPMVVHEYVHVLFRHSRAQYPVWLNEGLAEFFSTVAIEGGRATLGLVPLGRLQPLASGAPLMPLDRLFAVDRRAPEYNTKAHAGLFYSQSWALTHMLLSDERYRPQSGAFLERMASGAQAAPAMEAAFGRTAAVVFRDLESYVRRDRYQAVRFAYMSPPLGNDWPARAAAGFEGDLVLADLLANRPDREDDARTAFDALAKERPDDLKIAESRAHFELNHAGGSDVTPYLARAIDLGTRNAFLRRAYAGAVAGTDAAQAESVLASAIVADPDDAESRLDLATLLVRQLRAGEALTALAGIKRVPEESAFVFHQVSANANAQLGRLDAALAAAIRVQQTAHDDDERRHADQLRKSIEEFAAAQAEVERALRDRDAASRAAPRAGTTSAAAPPLPLFVEGRVTNLNCGNPPIVELTTGAGTLRLVIDDPLLIKVEGTGAITTDLTCGRQDTRVRIGYEPAVDTTRKTVGRIRVLDYRK